MQMLYSQYRYINISGLSDEVSKHKNQRKLKKSVPLLRKTILLSGREQEMCLEAKTPFIQVFKVEKPELIWNIFFGKECV